MKTHVTLVSPAATKELTIEAADARKPVSMEVPAGTYKLTIAAEHHRLLTRTIEIDKDVSLPEIALAGTPSISGRVVFRQGETEMVLAGAQILAGSRQLGTTNEQGLFHVDLPDDPTPDSITVMHTGQAPKTIPLYENLVAENELGTIELPRGVTLTVQLERRDERRPLTITVAGSRTSATREVKSADEEIPFSGLAPGNYRIVIQGTRPLEWMSDTVEVKQDDLQQKEVIAPFQLDGRVVVGNESLRGGGTAELLGPESSWRAQIPIDDDGRFGGVMWQTGKISASLKTALSPTAIIETSPDLGPGPSAWNIVLKRRAIQGRIFDGETKDAVPNVRLEVVTTVGDRKTESTAGVEKDGSYTIPAIQNGRYDLRVTSPDHADAGKTVLLGRDEETQIVDFPLEGGIEVELWLLWPNGDPVAGASIIADSGRRIMTNADGRAVMRLHARETRTLWVLPREGSFLLTDVTAPRSGSTKTQLVVPLPAGSIRITSRLAAPVIINYKGREFPPFVLQRLGVATGEPGVFRLVHLPAGDYGIFVRGARWVQVHLDRGEQAVEMVPIQPPARRPPKF